jgi:hypothetical protein
MRRLGSPQPHLQELEQLGRTKRILDSNRASAALYQVWNNEAHSAVLDFVFCIARCSWADMQ